MTIFSVKKLWFRNKKSANKYKAISKFLIQNVSIFKKKFEWNLNNMVYIVTKIQWVLCISVYFSETIVVQLLRHAWSLPWIWCIYWCFIYNLLSTTLTHMSFLQVFFFIFLSTAVPLWINLFWFCSESVLIVGCFRY